MNQPAVVQGRQEPANTNAALTNRGKSSPGARKRSGAAKPPGRTHEELPPQRDQLEIERIEHLHIIEAFMGAAAAHVMRLAYDSPDEWRALVQRPDGSRVQAPDAVADRAVELIRGLCRDLDSQIRAALSLPAEVQRRKYRLLPPRPKDSFDTALWLSPDERAAEAAAVGSMDVSAPVTRPEAPK
jgi:hypothetical protein